MFVSTESLAENPLLSLGQDVLGAMGRFCGIRIFPWSVIWSCGGGVPIVNVRFLFAMPSLSY